MRKKVLTKCVLVAIFAGILCAVPPASMAAPISGTLDITGTASVGATTIDWWPIGGGDGVFMVEPSSSGDFTPVTNTPGTAQDLDVTVQPVGSPFLLSNFLVFSAAPNIHFDLTFIEPGVFGPAGCAAAPAPGQTCTPLLPPPSSPFNLMNGPNRSSTASFNVKGLVRNDLGGVSNFIGTYTTQFTGMWYQDLLAVIQSGGTVSRSYSATFVVTPIPEPGTWSLILISGALFGISAQIRRFHGRG